MLGVRPSQIPVYRPKEDIPEARPGRRLRGFAGQDKGDDHPLDPDEVEYVQKSRALGADDFGYRGEQVIVSRQPKEPGCEDMDIRAEARETANDSLPNRPLESTSRPAYRLQGQ